MTKINKKQFYVIAGLAGIIATAAAFAFPLQTAESGVAGPEECGSLGLLFLFPDGPCVPEELCAEFDGEFCLFLFPEPVCVLEHWDKIIFKNKKDILNAGGIIIPKNSVMDIKVIDDPNQIEFPMKKAVDKLNSVSWTTVDLGPITIRDLKLIDIEYAIICVGFFDGFPNGDLVS